MAKVLHVDWEHHKDGREIEHGRRGICQVISKTHHHASDAGMADELESGRRA